jgi:hypothetical protein
VSNSTATTTTNAWPAHSNRSRYVQVTRLERLSGTQSGSRHRRAETALQLGRDRES